MSNANKKSLNKQIGQVNDMMKSPCTITEAVQISRGVAEDVVADYHAKVQHLHISMSLQIEMLKELAIKSGIITEEEFLKLYEEKAKELQKVQRDMMNKDSGVADMKVTAGDVEIKSE